jgi:hypothetical protein
MTQSTAARAALVLLALFAAVGCGQAEVKKTEDPAVIEQMRKEAMQNSQRELKGK